ncbi:MAG: TlpA disulfide reductase family protein [Bacteroidota bacterium]
MKHYILLFFMLWYGATTANTIKLTVINYSEPTAAILYTNYKKFSTDTLVKFALNKGVSTTITTAIPHHGFYMLIIGKRTIPVFLESKKDYELVMDYEEYPKNFKVNNASLFHELIYTINNDWVYSKKTTEEKETILMINAFTEKQSNLIKNAKGLTKKESDLLKVFVDGIVSIMKSTANAKGVDFFNQHLVNYSVNDELIYEVFPEKFLKSMLYNSYTLKYGENPSLQPVNYLKYISETVKNKVMSDYLSTQFVANQLRISDKEQANNLLSSLKAVLSTDQLLQAVSKQVEKKYKNNYLLPNLTLYTKDNKKISTQDFLGKIVVIDVWALWCEPCLAERPSYNSLEKKYNNSADLEVISISIDLDRKQWLKDVINSPSKNYWVDGGFRSEFAKAVDLVSIPRFIIINEKGIIINSDAPRPSTPELYTLIDSELKRLKKER